MSNEKEKISKKIEELEEKMRKNMEQEKQASKKRVDELEARIKALEEKLKK